MTKADRQIISNQIALMGALSYLLPNYGAAQRLLEGEAVKSLKMLLEADARESSAGEESVTS